MNSWLYRDGTLVRIKPKGSRLTNAAMYSIEVTKKPGISGSQGEVAFKVGSDGKATPKGPEDLKNPYEKAINPNQHDAYNDEAMKYGHQEAKPELPKRPPEKT
jgi:hypothetical protein